MWLSWNVIHTHARKECHTVSWMYYITDLHMNWHMLGMPGSQKHYKDSTDITIRWYGTPSDGCSHPLNHIHGQRWREKTPSVPCTKWTGAMCTIWTVLSSMVLTCTLYLRHLIWVEKQYEHEENWRQVLLLWGNYTPFVKLSILSSHSDCSEQCCDTHNEGCSLVL